MSIYRHCVSYARAYRPAWLLEADPLVWFVTAPSERVDAFMFLMLAFFAPVANMDINEGSVREFNPSKRIAPPIGNKDRNDNSQQRECHKGKRLQFIPLDPSKLPSSGTTYGDGATKCDFLLQRHAPLEMSITMSQGLVPNYCSIERQQPVGRFTRPKENK